jgi:hypothetical protein
MSQSNRYKWLIVVEGSNDVNFYHHLLTENGVNKNDFRLHGMNGKGFACNSTTWGSSNNKLLQTVTNDIGRIDFAGIILVVDADSDNNKAFDAYKRSETLPYVDTTIPNPKKMGVYWHLDNLNGSAKIPIYGIRVPVTTAGCLETDLLESYGFPTPKKNPTEYSNFVDIIKKSTDKWQVPKHGDGKEWWEENFEAKIDKFIYWALYHGFRVSKEKTSRHIEPDVIKNIKSIIGVP